jgi:predicted metal-dependent hydrolase
MTALKYLQAYPAALQDQVRQLIADDRLGDYLTKRYPEKHGVQSDKALYTYALDLKQEYLRNAPAIDKVLFDNRLDLTHRALGLHTTISRVQGGKLKAKKEIRVASLFKEAPSEFLKMIVVHELAHFKESDHNKAFYKLCEHMLPGYHQVEFDLRVYLTWRDMQSRINGRECLNGSQQDQEQFLPPVVRGVLDRQRAGEQRPGLDRSHRHAPAHGAGHDCGVGGPGHHLRVRTGRRCAQSCGALSDS